MSERKVNLKLSITQKADRSYDYQYFSLLDNGAIVKVEGFIINHRTKFVIELSERTQSAYSIKECLIPGLQTEIEVKKISDNEVVILDNDDDIEDKDYNFIIIAINKHTGEQIVCDPQIRNRGSF